MTQFVLPLAACFTRILLNPSARRLSLGGGVRICGTGIPQPESFSTTLSFRRIRLITGLIFADVSWTIRGSKGDVAEWSKAPDC